MCDFQGEVDLFGSHGVGSTGAHLDRALQAREEKIASLLGLHVVNLSGEFQN